jgi:nitrogen-specific signal transduction histidine kinase/ActR/RegA family two-component response regulator
MEQSQNHQWAELGESLGLGTAWIHDGRFLDCNPLFARFLGEEKDKLLGQSVSNFFPQFDPMKIFHVFDGGKNVYEDRFRLQHTGQVYDIKVSRCPGESVDFILVLSRDRETPLRLELKRLRNVELFSGIVGHEFNNVLMKTKNYLALTKHRLKDEKAVLRLNKAELSLDSSKSFTKKLLSLSSTDNFQEQEVSSLLSELLSLSVFASGIRFQCDMKDDLHSVYVDEGAMTHILFEVLSNAADAMHGEGVIQIQTANITLSEKDVPKGKSAGDYVRIGISDGGDGVPQSLKQKILYSSCSTKEGHDGMGLPLVVSLLQQQKGFLSLANKEAGAVFHLYLPAFKDARVTEAEEKENTFEIVSSTDAMPVKTDSRKILVMDDDWEIRDVVSMMLESMGYEVELAQNGDELLEMLSGRDIFPELIILDLTIRNGKGGFETFQELKKRYKGLKVFVSSGYQNHPMMTHFAHYGFSGSIPKPYDYDDLEKLLLSSINNKD